MWLTRSLVRFSAASKASLASCSCLVSPTCPGPGHGCPSSLTSALTSSVLLVSSIRSDFLTLGVLTILEAKPIFSNCLGCKNVSAAIILVTLSTLAELFSLINSMRVFSYACRSLAAFSNSTSLPPITEVIGLCISASAACPTRLLSNGAARNGIIAAE